MKSPSLRHVPVFQPHRQTPVGVWRVELNGLVLFGLILAYFGILIFALDRLIILSETVRDSLFSGEGALLANVLLAVAFFSPLMLLVARLIFTIFQILYGLVTAKHDEEAYQSIDGVVLDPNENRQIYQLVLEVGRQVGAPPPDAIWATHHADCYAVELRRFGISTQRQLILVLGMPHLEVLTVSELKVILAHELAHFRGDTRLAVFAFRFFESLRSSTEAVRDRWWSRLDPVYLFSKAYIQLFLVLSAPVRRYQELRADCWSAAVYGGGIAGRTLLKEWQIGAQFDATVASFKPTSEEDPHERDGNVFRWFRTGWREFSDSGYEYLRRRLAVEEKATFWDSHPTIESRLAIMGPFPDRGTLDGRPVHQLLPNLGDLEERLHQHIFVGNG